MVEDINKRVAVLTVVQRRLADHHMIAAIWAPEDLKEIRPDLTDDQAWQVLQLCEIDHDPNRGITWDVLRAIADRLFPRSLIIPASSV